MEFEASPNMVTVSIPLAVWEVVRQHAGVNLSLINVTDEDLRHRAEDEMDIRIERFRAAQENKKPLFRSNDILAYGPVESSRETQVARRVKQLTELRDKQRQIKDEIRNIMNESGKTCTDG